MLISAGYIVYLGPFTSKYRNDLIGEWIQSLLEKNIPTSSDFKLIQYILSYFRILSSDAEI